ncbi:MAG: FixH family protein [Novosphingobium sp.]
MSRPFTGRHMTVILVAFFAVVIGVNFVMARYATSTFGGVVVENSYVASQHFNRWLDEAAREKALDLHAAAKRTSADRVAVEITGSAADARLSAFARHPLGRTADLSLQFDRNAAGQFVSREVLPRGRWRVRLKLDDKAGTWRTEQDVF